MLNNYIGIYPALNEPLNVLHDVPLGLCSDIANTALVCTMKQPVGCNCLEVDNKGCQHRKQVNLINAGHDPLLDVCLATSG